MQSRKIISTVALAAMAILSVKSADARSAWHHNLAKVEKTRRIAADGSRIRVNHVGAVITNGTMETTSVARPCLLAGLSR